MSFYDRSTLAVARDLVGRWIVRETADREILVARIVETEAYCGVRDQACHSFGGRNTTRVRSMWGPPGRSYVYRIYGIHHCWNVVTRAAGRPEAVLIRAAAPIAGTEAMRARRGVAGDVPVEALARGPGNLCRALGIDLADDGASVVDGSLTVREGAPVQARDVARGPRVGVASAGAWAARRWRFALRGHPAVSRPRVSTPSNPR